MSTTCVIAQPTYFCWAGTLDAFDQADVVVLLDTVQFSRQSWQQRNRILTAQGVHWLTVPVQHPTRVPIRDVRVDHTQPWARDHLRTLRTAYQSAPGWWYWWRTALEQYYEDAAQPGELWRVNRASLLLMAPHHLLRVLLASELAVATGTRETLVLNICRAVGATHYVAAPGSAAYLAAHNPFPGSGITLVYHDYEPEPYPQVHGGGAFIPRLSALDLLLNVDGPDRAWQVIRAGRRPRRDANEVHAAWRRTHQAQEEVTTNGI